eukprot:gene16741-biopygen9810
MLLQPRSNIPPPPHADPRASHVRTPALRPGPAQLLIPRGSHYVWVDVMPPPLLRCASELISHIVSCFHASQPEDTRVPASPRFNQPPAAAAAARHGGGGWQRWEHAGVQITPELGEGSL